MNRLRGFQRRYLRGLANRLNPVVQIGKAGLTPNVIMAIDQALDNHELIKIRFLDFKDVKKEMSSEIEEAVHAEMVGIIGHTALFYRQHADETRRVITLPE